MHTPIRVGLYTRVSTDIQAAREEGSLDTQEARLRSAVDARAGAHEVRRVYREEGQSGKSLNRPEVQRLIADAKSGELDLVLVTRLDRLSRSLVDFYQLHNTFQGHGVSFYSLNEAFDTSSPMGRAMLKIILVFAELEREQTADRTRQAMRARAERGLWNGGRPPLGYDSMGSGHLVINKDEAALIRLIYKKYPEMRSATKVANWLNEQGYRTKRFSSRRKGASGGKTFSHATVRQALRNPLYLGKVSHKDEWFEGQHKAIIPEAEWQRVQTIMDGNAKNRRGPPLRARHNYLLTSLLRCSCGYAMTTSAGTGRSRLYFYYRCIGIQKKGDHVCKVKQMPAEKLEEAIIELVRRAAKQPSLLETAVAEAERLLCEQLGPIREQLATLKREQDTAEQEGRILFERILDAGLTSSDIAREKLAAAEQHREQLKRAIQKVEQELAQQTGTPLDLAPLKAAVQGFDSAFDGMSPAEKREFLSLMIHQITVFKDRMEVDLYDGRHAVAWLVRVHGDRIRVHTKAADREQTPEGEKPRAAAGRFVADQNWLPLLDTLRTRLLMPDDELKASMELYGRIRQ